MWLRFALYACLLPPIGVGLGLGRHSHAATVMAVGVAVCVAAFLWPRARRAVAAYYERSRTLRLADAVFWNLSVVFLVGEATLAIASQLSNHPLLASPNAGTQSRIETQRQELLAFYGADGVNARGFNDTEWSREPGDAFRIVALGDSFAFGVVGYQRNFLTLLETELSARVGRRVEVANLGIPGMQPQEYLQILLDDGLALHPDLVLLCLYIGNDFQPAASTSRFDASNWRMVGFASRLVRYAAESEFRGSTAAAKGAPTTGGSAPPFTEDNFLRIVQAYIPLLRRELTPRAERGLRETLAVADEIVARARPAPVAIALLPSEVQVSPRLRAQVLERVQIGEADLDLDHPARETRNHFEPKKVLVIDLLPALTAAERDASTYALRNTHWNGRGNAIAARQIAESLAPMLRELALAPMGSAPN
jgi:lysophospholipase L1-like esterase